MMSSDCFAAPRLLMTLAEAVTRIGETTVAVTGEELVPLDQAAGRVLARPVLASLTQPPFANAAMDGFAVRYSELGARRRLPVAARIAAGHLHHGALPDRCAVRIFTGAPLPDGFDTVVMQEDCQVDGDDVILPERIRPGAHVRDAGIDFTKDDLLVEAGQRLLPQHIGIIAATGDDAVWVRKRLRIGLFSTGDELVPPGQALSAGQIHDSNRPMLRAALMAMGFEVTDLGQLDDQLDSLVTAFGLAGLDQDVLISTGGVSVGGEDHVRAAIEKLGQLHFWKLAIKPGKPVALGQIGNTVFLGLPGNPVSSLISLLLVGRPLLHRLGGADRDALAPAPIRVPSAVSLVGSDNRTSFLRASLVQQDGELRALPYFSQDSSLISSLVNSQGLIEVDCGDRQIPVGADVNVHLFDRLMR